MEFKIKFKIIISISNIYINLYDKELWLFWKKKKEREKKNNYKKFALTFDESESIEKKDDEKNFFNIESDSEKTIKNDINLICLLSNLGLPCQNEKFKINDIPKNFFNEIIYRIKKTMKFIIKFVWIKSVIFLKEKWALCF